MAQLIRPGSVKVRSQDGEVQVTIALELTINLNTEGLSIAAAAAPIQAQQQGVLENAKEKAKKNDVVWEIPDFGTTPKVDFGKKQ